MEFVDHTLVGPLTGVLALLLVFLGGITILDHVGLPGLAGNGYLFGSTIGALVAHQFGRVGRAILKQVGPGRGAGDVVGLHAVVAALHADIGCLIGPGGPHGLSRVVLVGCLAGFAGIVGLPLYPSDQMGNVKRGSIVNNGIRA